MEFLLNIDQKKLPVPINYRDKILLTGSCFTEHIGSSLEQLKFNTLQNPNGILFGPDSVCRCLISYVENKVLSTDDLFRVNEIWHSWQHHSRFSHVDPVMAVKAMNASTTNAHTFLKDAGWVLITLGSAFSYRLTADAAYGSEKVGHGVANCHRAPAGWFEKKLLETDQIVTMLGQCLDQLLQFNPQLRFIFTISPVRHIRDGVVENNRSKARLIEAVHQVTTSYESACYFPAYELVIDVLRDYRFYDIDLVHPNYAAKHFVFEQFAEHCIDDDSRKLMEEVRKIVTARKHKAFQPETRAHQQFLASHYEKAKALQDANPFLDLKKELVYFSEL